MIKLQGYAVSIACEDQLSLEGTKFILRFTRPEQDDPADSFNPHDDAEPFLTSILQQHGQGRLAPSLERLVMVLRDTLPIAVELEKIRKGCQQQGYHVDTFAKASGWYRLLYPTLKYVIFSLSSPCSYSLIVDFADMRWISGS